MCFFVYKTVCAAFIWMPWDARSCRYVFILRENFILYLKCNFKKVLEQERKTFFLNEQKSRDAAAKKYRYKRSRDK